MIGMHPDQAYTPPMQHPGDLADVLPEAGACDECGADPCPCTDCDRDTTQTLCPNCCAAVAA